MLEKLMEKPTCQLSGEDGNVFSIIGRVSKSLKRAGCRVHADEFMDRAFKAESYDNVILLAMEYCEIN